MNIYTEHPNIFPKEIFHVFKNQDFQPSKIRHFPLEIHQSETNHYSKENAAKGIALKHEFKTPAIMNSHKLPKAFNNVSNDRLNHEKINEIIKKPESKYNI